MLPAKQARVLAGMGDEGRRLKDLGSPLPSFRAAMRHDPLLPQVRDT
jgi:hypothetical protein